jgi:hypothetical protein
MMEVKHELRYSDNNLFVCTLTISGTMGNIYHGLGGKEQGDLS